MHLSRLQVLVSPCVHAARRGVDNIADISMRRYSLGAGVVRDIKSPLTRQPFSTISSTISSQENVENVTAESNMLKQKLQKTLAINNFPFTTTTTTSKAETVVDEENRTPKAMPIPASTIWP
jgi:protein regulator of cytokinesis 1